MLINDNVDYKSFCSAMGSSPNFFEVYKTYFFTLPSPFNKAQMMEDLFIKFNTPAILEDILSSITPVQSRLITLVHISRQACLPYLFSAQNCNHKLEFAKALNNLLAKGILIQTTVYIVINPAFKEDFLNRFISVPVSSFLATKPEKKLISNFPMFLYTCLSLIINRKATANGVIRKKKSDYEIFDLDKEVFDELLADATNFFKVCGILNNSTGRMKINEQKLVDFFSTDSFRQLCGFFELKEFGLYNYKKHYFRSMYFLIFNNARTTTVQKAFEACILAGYSQKAIAHFLSLAYTYGLIDWDDRTISLRDDEPQSPSLDTDLKVTFFSRPPRGSVLPVFCEPIKCNEASVFSFSRQSVFSALSCGLEVTGLEKALTSSFFASQLEAFLRDFSRSCIYEGTVLVLEADCADYVAQSPVISEFIIKRLSQKVFFMKGSKADVKIWSAQVSKLLGNKAEIPVVTQGGDTDDELCICDWDDDDNVPSKSGIVSKPDYKDVSQSHMQDLKAKAEAKGLLREDISQAIDSGTVFREEQLCHYQGKSDKYLGDYSDLIMEGQDHDVLFYHAGNLLRLSKCRKLKESVSGLGFNVVDGVSSFVYLPRFEKPVMFSFIHN